MPRLSRLDAPSVLHHVMGRGIERRKIFINNKGSLKNNFTELAPRFRSDLIDPKLQSHPAKGGTISRTLSRPGREGSGKDGLKMGCENAKLFLSEPYTSRNLCNLLKLQEFNEAITFSQAHGIMK